MRTLTDSDRNTLPRGWVRQAVMGMLKWKDVPTTRDDMMRGGTLKVLYLLEIIFSICRYRSVESEMILSNHSLQYFHVS
ncbi:hypothetical protein WA026_010761 [Henosepilachna vigintioctopunctata]|uniref:Uncharacterized protein n=1 Tax=Henosepilachna vigintioctopunctata TaxID=420089 RepID=A0AAW1UR16_9CUCU